MLKRRCQRLGCAVHAGSAALFSNNNMTLLPRSFARAGFAACAGLMCSALLLTGCQEKKAVQVQRPPIPVTYVTLRYDVADTHSQEELEARIRRDLAALVFDHLDYFQSFDSIAVYYDDGQHAVSAALHDALDFVLARNVADYRDADHGARRLLQAADYICTVERAAMAYDAGLQTRTHERFFGSRRSFMQSYMKQLVRKRLDGSHR